MLMCTHEKEGLVWEVELLLPWQKNYSYKYAIVRKTGHEVQVCGYASWEFQNYGALGFLAICREICNTGFCDWFG